MGMMEARGIIGRSKVGISLIVVPHLLDVRVAAWTLHV